MRVTPPLDLTGSRLTSSTAAEPGDGEVAWDAETEYAKGQQAYLPSSHIRYERLVAGTTETSPDQDPENWAELGPTNRFAMFDLLRNTGTVSASPFTVVLTPGQRVDSLGLVGVVADSVTVEMHAGGELRYSRTLNMRVRDVTSWFEYFFSPFGYRSAAALFDLPPFVSGVITVTFTRATGDITVGGLILGMSVYLGDTQYSAESDALNFSVVERDTFGNSRLVPRRTVPKTTQSLLLPKHRVNQVIRARETLNAVPALWSGLDDDEHAYFEALLILGYYRRFTVNLEHPDIAVISLELEEV